MSDAVTNSLQTSGVASEFVSLPLEMTDMETVPCVFSNPLEDGTPSFIQPQSSGSESELHEFWKQQYDDIVCLRPEEMKAHSLPLARIKKIMKSDEDVRMISAEAPILFSKACEIFILELTRRAWNHAEGNKRRTVQRSDIAAAVSSTDIFDFLVDIVPREGFDNLMDAGMMDTSPITTTIATNQQSEVYPGQGTVINAPTLANAFNPSHSNQHRVFPQYLQFDQH